MAAVSVECATRSVQAMGGAAAGATQGAGCRARELCTAVEYERELCMAMENGSVCICVQGRWPRVHHEECRSQGPCLLACLCTLS